MGELSSPFPTLYVGLRRALSVDEDEHERHPLRRLDARDGLKANDGLL